MIRFVIPIALGVLVAACGGMSAEDAARGACGVTDTMPLTGQPMPWSDGGLEFRFANGTFVKLVNRDGQWVPLDNCQR